MLCYAMLCFAMLCYALLRSMLCFATLYALLCYATLYYALLYHVVAVLAQVYRWCIGLLSLSQASLCGGAMADVGDFGALFGTAVSQGDGSSTQGYGERATKLHGAYSTGASERLWLVDVAMERKQVFFGEPMLFSKHPKHGWNNYVLFVMHPTHWCFAAYAVWCPSMRACEDISQLLCQGSAHYPTETAMLGFYSALFIIACLWPWAQRKSLLWLEVVVLRNNYDGESGTQVLMRHHSQPWLCWVNVGAEAFVANVLDLFNPFTSIKLPRFLMNGGYNFAAWLPYEVSGPRFFVYDAPQGWSMKQCFLRMFQEQEAIAQHSGPKLSVSPQLFAEVATIYQAEYAEGPWLSESERHALTYHGKARL